MEAGLRWGEGHAGGAGPGTGQESRAFAGALAHPGLREAALWSGMDLSERSELSMPDHALSRFPEALDVPGPETSPDFLARSGKQRRWLCEGGKGKGIEKSRRRASVSEGWFCGFLCVSGVASGALSFWGLPGGLWFT